MKTYRFTYSREENTREMEICTEYMDSEGTIWSRGSVPMNDVKNDIPQCRVINKKIHTALALSVHAMASKFVADNALSKKEEIPSYGIFILRDRTEVFIPYILRNKIGDFLTSCRMLLNRRSKFPSENPISKIALVRLIPEEESERKDILTVHAYINIISFSELSKALNKKFDITISISDNQRRKTLINTSVDFGSDFGVVIRDSGEFKEIGRTLLAYLPGYAPDQAEFEFEDLK